MKLPVIEILILLGIALLVIWVFRKYFTVNYKESTPPEGDGPVEGIAKGHPAKKVNPTNDKITSHRKLSHPIANEVDAMVDPDKSEIRKKSENGSVN
jgi:hypothetical protein